MSSPLITATLSNYNLENKHLFYAARMTLAASKVDNTSFTPRDDFFISNKGQLKQLLSGSLDLYVPRVVAIFKDVVMHYQYANSHHNSLLSEECVKLIQQLQNMELTLVYQGYWGDVQTGTKAIDEWIEQGCPL